MKRCLADSLHRPPIQLALTAAAMLAPLAAPANAIDIVRSTSPTCSS